MAAQIPRTLIADDQPDVRAALRLLLKGAGYQTEAADSPAAVLDAIKQQKFDLVLMDLNYARDTTSGKEGLDLISQNSGARSRLADRRDDRLGHRRSRSRIDAARRARLCAKALGKLSPAAKVENSDRAGPGAQTRARVANIN